jgi:hypothetical protein
MAASENQVTVSFITYARAADTSVVSRLLSPRTWAVARLLFALQVVVTTVVAAVGVIAGINLAREMAVPQRGPSVPWWTPQA